MDSAHPRHLTWKQYAALGSGLPQPPDFLLNEARAVADDIFAMGLLELFIMLFFHYLMFAFVGVILHLITGRPLRTFFAGKLHLYFFMAFMFVGYLTLGWFSSAISQIWSSFDNDAIYPYKCSMCDDWHRSKVVMLHETKRHLDNMRGL